MFFVCFDLLVSHSRLEIVVNCYGPLQGWSSAMLLSRCFFYIDWIPTPDYISCLDLEEAVLTLILPSVRHLRDLFQSSIAAMSALVSAMHSDELACLVRRVYNARSAPKLGILVPSLKRDPETQQETTILVNQLGQ